MIITEAPADLPICTNKDLRRSLDCLITRSANTSRQDFLELFKIEDPKETIYLIGTAYVLRIDVDGSKTIFKAQVPIKFPSLLEQIAGASVPNISIQAPPEVSEARLAICKGCDQYDAANQKCAKCGCGTYNKLRSLDGTCPLSKW